jgi:hypothetical protein
MYIDQNSNLDLQGNYFSPARGARAQSNALRYTDYAAPLGYRVTQTADKGLVAEMATNDFARIGWKQRLRFARPLNPFYMDRNELSLGAFIYAFWHTVAELLLIRRGCTFIHSSCVEKGGRALVLAALGGVGKTSTMYQLVLEGGWNFVADDLAILGDDGTLWGMPDAMAVYPYNLVGLTDIAARVKAMQGGMERLHWRFWEGLRGADGVGRRIDAAALFGQERITRKAALERIIYLMRWSGDAFELKPMSAEDLATRATSIILGEMRQFRHEYQAWNAVPNFNLFPPLWQVGQEMYTVFCKAFQTHAPQVLYVPRSAPPKQVYEYIVKHLEA